MMESRPKISVIVPIYNRLITFWLNRRFYYTLDVILSVLIRK